MERKVPVEPFTPGEYIKEELEARNWSQEDLAQVLGITRRQVANLLSGSSGLSPDIAVSLGNAFGQDPKTWMELQINYELSVAAKKHNDVARRSAVFSKAPIREMKKRCWIADVDDIDEMEAALCKFLRINSINDTPSFAVAARKSTSYEYNSAAQIAWYARARQLAEGAPAGQYVESGFEDGVVELLKLAARPEDARRIPNALGEMGIRLVLVQHLSGTKMEGVAFWLDSNSPAIALTLRYDRMDNLWFNLLHELVHIKYRHEFHIDCEGADGSLNAAGELPEMEVVANTEGANYLIPKAKLDSFIKRIRPLYYRERVIQFAQAMGVHPAIAVGQLHKRKELNPSQLRKLLVPIREHIVGQAITDGWGNDLWLE